VARVQSALAGSTHGRVALGTDPIRERALVIERIGRVLQRSRALQRQHDQRDGQAREMLAHVLPFPAR
jgi:hypothetical protein